MKLSDSMTDPNCFRLGQVLTSWLAGYIFAFASTIIHILDENLILIHFWVK